MGAAASPKCCSSGAKDQALSADDHGEVAAAPEDLITAEPSSPQATAEGDAAEVAGPSENSKTEQTAGGGEASAPLTDAELQLVESTWETAAALGAEVVGVLLFRQIFELAPEALQLFPFKDEADPYESDKLKTHATGVVAAVGKAVAGLRDLEALAPVLQDLGKRHVGYGVLPPHYDVVGQALMRTLKAGLGEALTAEAEAAWAKVWSLVAATMIGKHYEAEPAGAEAAPATPADGADAGGAKKATAAATKPKAAAGVKKKAPDDAKKKAPDDAKKKKTKAEAPSGDADKKKDAAAPAAAPEAAPEAPKADDKEAEFFKVVAAGDDGALRKLLKAGVAPTVVNSEGLTALHISAGAGHEEVTGRLVMQKGIKLDAKAKGTNDTPLHMACRGNHRDVAVIIVRAGAKVSIKNGAGKTPQQEAKDQLAAWLGNKNPEKVKPPWQ